MPTRIIKQILPASTVPGILYCPEDATPEMIAALETRTRADDRADPVPRPATATPSPATWPRLTAARILEPDPGERPLPGIFRGRPEQDSDDKKQHRGYRQRMRIWVVTANGSSPRWAASTPAPSGDPV